MNINLVERILSGCNENSWPAKMKNQPFHIKYSKLNFNHDDSFRALKSQQHLIIKYCLWRKVQKKVIKEKLTFFMSSQLHKLRKLWACTWYGRGIMLNGFLISRLVTLITVCCLNLLHVYIVQKFPTFIGEEMERLEVIERGKYYINIQEACKPQTYFVAHHRC